MDSAANLTVQAVVMQSLVWKEKTLIRPEMPGWLQVYL
jgi:hypothetical protein